MKKYLILVLIVLIIGTLFIGVQVASGKVTKLTGKDAVVMIPTLEMFPDSGYPTTYQIDGAKGKVNMIQPNGNVDVILGVSVDDLDPSSLYTVYFDWTGVTQGEWSTNGPWELMDEFWTDTNGHGEWNFTAPAGSLEAGPYTISVYINRADVNHTVLISYNIGFDIVPE